MRQLVACIALLACPGFAAELTLNERAYLASRIYASLANFAHWQDARDVDVDAAYRTYLNKALAGADRVSFSRASMEFLATLRNGHTMFLDMVLVQQGGSLPFTARFVGNKWITTESRNPEVKPGDVLETIDGRPFEQFFGDQRRFISASKEEWARYALFARLPGFAPYAQLFPVVFVAGFDGGRHVTIDRRAAKPSPPIVTEGRWLEPGKVAYIRIPSFMSPEFEKRGLELVREFRDSAALIVDVRGNMGGNTPGELIAALMDRPYHWWTESTPVLLPYFRFEASRGGWQYQPFDRPEFLWRSGDQQPPKDSFKGKLILLVDGGCHSSCEDFTMPFKDSRRALIVGETTAGSTGQPYMLDLKNGMTLMVGAKREMFPDGSRFEGVGIRPDLEIEPALEDIRQERDAVLEAARKRL